MQLVLIRRTAWATGTYRQKTGLALGGATQDLDRSPSWYDGYLLRAHLTSSIEHVPKDSRYRSATIGEVDSPHSCIRDAIDNRSYQFVSKGTTYDPHASKMQFDSIVFGRRTLEQLAPDPPSSLACREAGAVLAYVDFECSHVPSLG